MPRTTKKPTAPIEKRTIPTVPEAEWPYPMPENWRWVRLNNIVNISTGKKDANYGCDNGMYPFFTCAAEAIRCNGYSFDGEALLLPGNGANVGQVYYYSGKFEAYQRTYVLQKLSKYICIRYLYYHILCFWENYNRDKQYGSATNYIKLGNFIKYLVPLPPLAEQQRIVDRIERLFAKLDEAREKAQAVVDGFENRKATILHKAFTGELTRKWREERGIGMESWKTVAFDDCIELMQNGLSKRKGNIGNEFVVLRLANLSEDGFIEEDLRKIVLDEKEQRNYELHPDDVLMIRVNGSKDNVGKQYLIEMHNGWAFCDHIIRIRYKDIVLSRYMVYFSKSEIYRLYIKNNMVSSAGQNTISRKGLAHLQIPIPLYEEQKEIVAKLIDLFAQERRARDLAESVIAQINGMKKAILARAFRGELGTNDPSEAACEG